MFNEYNIHLGWDSINQRIANYQQIYANSDWPVRSKHVETSKRKKYSHWPNKIYLHRKPIRAKITSNTTTLTNLKKVSKPHSRLLFSSLSVE